MPIFTSPLMINDPSPALITAAPAKPPMRAWEELVGRPQYQVMRFQTMAPINAAKTTALVDDAGLDDTAFPRSVATLTPKPNAATKLKNAAQATACIGREDTGRHDGRDGIGGIVKSIDEVEDERDDDDERDGGQLTAARYRWAVVGRSWPSAVSYRLSGGHAS